MGLRGAIGITLSLVLATMAGCRATPERVCDHLGTLGALPPEGFDCMAVMATMEKERPDEWSDVRSCFMSAVDAEETSVCYTIITNLAMQRTCKRVLESVPSAFEGSTPACQRALRTFLREDVNLWREKLNCLTAAENLAEIETCEVPGASGGQQLFRPLEERNTSSAPTIRDAARAAGVAIDNLPPVEASETSP